MKKFLTHSKTVLAYLVRFFAIVLLLTFTMAMFAILIPLAFIWHNIEPLVKPNGYTDRLTELAQNQLTVTQQIFNEPSSL